MPEDPRNNSPTPDPATDIFLCRATPATNGPVMPEGNCTRLFAHKVPGSTPIFYLSYRLEPSDTPVIRRFDSTTDAAAFILGLAGFGLAGIPEPDQYRIREFFPGWFRHGKADSRVPSHQAGADPENPVLEYDAGDKAARCPDNPAGSSASMQPRNNRHSHHPLPEAATDRTIPRQDPESPDA